MIPRASRNGAILLAALLVASIWAFRQHRARDILPTAGLDTRLDYALSHFEFRAYDTDGQPAVVLTAPRFTSDAASGEGLATKPLLEVHHGGRLWNIIAESATVTEDREFIHLTGQVELERIGRPPDRWLKMKSSEVTLEVTPRIARSEQYVEVNDAVSLLTATGFWVNMKEDNYRLLGDVKGHYVLQ